MYNILSELCHAKKDTVKQHVILLLQIEMLSFSVWYIWEYAPKWYSAEILVLVKHCGPSNSNTKMDKI